MPEHFGGSFVQVSPQARLLHGKIYYIADRMVKAILGSLPCCNAVSGGCWHFCLDHGPGVTGSRRFQTTFRNCQPGSPKQIKTFCGTGVKGVTQKVGLN